MLSDNVTKGVDRAPNRPFAALGLTRGAGAPPGGRGVLPERDCTRAI